MFKILVAEDDNSARRLLCEVLSGYGYETIPAVDGAQALELLQAHHADLIVLDVMMPRMDGLQLTRRLREEGHTTPILMLTARETTQDQCRGFLSGADDYVVKPVDEEELALRIAALLRRSQIASERKIVVGDVTLSYDTQSVTRGDTLHRQLVAADVEKIHRRAEAALVEQPGRGQSVGAIVARTGTNYRGLRRAPA